MATPPDEGGVAGVFQEQTVGRVGGRVTKRPYPDQTYYANKSLPEIGWSRYALRLTLGATRPPEVARYLKLSDNQKIEQQKESHGENHLIFE